MFQKFEVKRQEQAQKNNQKKQPEMTKSETNFCVCHADKLKGSIAPMGAVVRRQNSDGSVNVPVLVDPERICLNQTLVDVPGLGSDGIEAEVDKIIAAAQVRRKITPDQPRAIMVSLSGSPARMAEILSEGRIAEWANDSLEWCHQTFGEGNVAFAILHLDQTTPNLVAIVTPITTEPSRKRKANRKYKETEEPVVRLSADHFMTKPKMFQWQDSYAAAMTKYGLVRGERKSKARHQSLWEYPAKKREDLPESKDALEAMQRELVEAAKELERMNEVIKKRLEQFK